MVWSHGNKGKLSKHAYTLKQITVQSCILSNIQWTFPPFLFWNAATEMQKWLVSPNFVFFVMVFIGFPNQNPEDPLSFLEEWFSKVYCGVGSVDLSAYRLWHLALCPCARAVTLAGFQVRHRIAAPYDGRAVLRLVWVRGRRVHHLCVRVFVCVCVRACGQLSLWLCVFHHRLSKLRLAW